MRRFFSAATVMLLALGCARTPTETPQQRHADLYRAFRSIDGAIAMGVTHLQLGELLQRAATQVAISGDTTKAQDEVAMVKSYTEALEAYADSQKLWAKQISYASEAYAKGFIPVEAPIMEIPKKYGLSEVERKLSWGTSKWIHEEGAVQAVWNAAEKKAEAARREYFALGAKH